MPNEVIHTATCGCNRCHAHRHAQRLQRLEPHLLINPPTRPWITIRQRQTKKRL